MKFFLGSLAIVAFVLVVVALGSLYSDALVENLAYKGVIQTLERSTDLEFGYDEEGLVYIANPELVWDLKKGESHYEISHEGIGLEMVPTNTLPQNMTSLIASYYNEYNDQYSVEARMSPEIQQEVWDKVFKRLNNQGYRLRGMAVVPVVEGG